MPMERRPIVGVMGSGDREYPDKSEPLGRWLAEVGVNLLTGGGEGVMTAVSRAFVSVQNRKGASVGVLPAQQDLGPATYPNRWVEIRIQTHLPLTGEHGSDPLSRNHINILSSDVLVALPGSAGTASEVALAVAYARPLIAFVDTRMDIPGLDQLPWIPSAGTLLDVQRFVLRNIQIKG